jgi:hypothetical protein
MLVFGKVCDFGYLGSSRSRQARERQFAVDRKAHRSAMRGHRSYRNADNRVMSFGQPVFEPGGATPGQLLRFDFGYHSGINGFRGFLVSPRPIWAAEIAISGGFLPPQSPMLGQL